MSCTPVVMSEVHSSDTPVHTTKAHSAKPHAKSIRGARSSTASTTRPKAQEHSRAIHPHAVAAKLPFTHPIQKTETAIAAVNIRVDRDTIIISPVYGTNPQLPSVRPK